MRSQLAILAAGAELRRCERVTAWAVDVAKQRSDLVGVARSLRCVVFGQLLVGYFGWQKCGRAPGQKLLACVWCSAQRLRAECELGRALVDERRQDVGRACGFAR